MSDPSFQFKVVRERTYSAHHALQHIAARAADAAEKEERGSFNNALVAITLSAFSIEAMANAIGDRIVPHWVDFESASPFAKSRLMAEHLQIQYMPDAEPWQSVRWLGKFRNRIAHAKPEKILDESFTDGSSFEIVGEKPDSKIEAEITPANARRAVSAVESLKDLLCDRIPADQRFGMNIDGWIVSSELQPKSEA
jgi:hypothetical protein